MKTSHSAYSSIMKLYRAGIIDGSNNNFNPEGNVTEKQMAKILTNLFKFDTNSEHEATVLDVKKSDWSYPYVQAMLLNDVMYTNNGYFFPNYSVSRGNFAYYLFNALYMSDSPLFINNSLPTASTTEVAG